MKLDVKKGVLTLPTSLSPDELREKLRKWEPWMIRIDFTNGVSTSEYKQSTPFAEYPLGKFGVVEGALPLAEFAGGKLLDVACNSGYNSLYAAARFGMTSTGIDVLPRHIEVSRFLSELAGIPADFLLGTAENFSRPEQFDLILHFGTLYHLPNPVLSLTLAFENLKPGGYLALETQVYDHPEDDKICYYMHMQNNDPSNFWALSTSVLKNCLELQGFGAIRELLKVVPKEGLARHMSRIVLVAQRPA